MSDQRMSRRGTLASQQSSATRWVEKKKEVEAVIALEAATADFLRRFEALAIDFDVVKEAGKVHGSVLAHWPHMFGLVALFLNKKRDTNPDDDDESYPPPIDSLVGERLVRVPVEALRLQDNE